MHFAFTSSENKHTKWAQKTLALYFYFKQTSNHTCANHTFHVPKFSSCSCLPVAYIACRLILSADRFLKQSYYVFIFKKVLNCTCANHTLHVPKFSSCSCLQVAYLICKLILSAGCFLLHCLSLF